MEKQTLSKEERLCSRKAVERLFAGRASSFSAFPVRVVFLPTEEPEAAWASVLMSVSKKRFKRAVKRNRVKRQLREAYRKNKHELVRCLAEQNRSLHLAFIYLDKTLHPTDELEKKVVRLLDRIVQSLKERP